MFEADRKWIKNIFDQKVEIRNTPDIYWNGNQIKETHYPYHRAAGKILSRYCDTGTKNSI